MVASEQVRGAGLGDVPPAGSGAPAWSEGTLHISPAEARELLGTSAKRDDGLLAALARDPRPAVRVEAYRAMSRTGDLAANEDVFREAGATLLAGADEAGRGALAGPLVAAAVVFAPGFVLEGAGDSKSLAPVVRESLYEVILSEALKVSVSFIGPGLIDRWGVQAVNRRALGDAVRGLDGRCHCVICDHFRLEGLGMPSYGISKADATFQSVAAASIVAKVERDRAMKMLHRRTPLYNFGRNKGYATGEHLAALRAHGPTVHHRVSFHGVLDDPGEASLPEM